MPIDRLSLHLNFHQVTQVVVGEITNHDYDDEPWQGLTIKISSADGTSQDIDIFSVRGEDLDLVIEPEDTPEPETAEDDIEF